MTTYRIHPAIGIARVGNSPDEFFVGPERVGQVPDPPGGFKDAQCRVKRQGARFRIFAHNDDGSIEELTCAEADIGWTVHLVNAKAPFAGRGNSEPVEDLTIDPGPRTLGAPNGRAVFDSGAIRFGGEPAVTVPLGEICTDDDGRLLVLGGHGTSASPAGNVIGNFWGNAGWYDDVSDGPVTATITLRGTGATPPVEGAWVVVGPPKFAPNLDSVTTLYDRLLQKMIDAGRLPAPAATSYARDVHPVLQRARDMRWVEGILGAHTWPEPVVDQPTIDMIFARLGPGDMPRLNGSDGGLTPTQFAHMQRWKDGNYSQDWAGPPAPEADITPGGLDRAALEACVGGAFFPGIEAGGLADGQRPILEAAYTAPFRLDHSAVTAGTISASLALPWQADFKACGDNWWPVPRPNDVFRADGSAVRWDRDVASMDEMATKWHTLGFVVEQGSMQVETQHCDEPSIELLTPHLMFVDVAQGPMAMVRETALAISFEVASPAAAVTLDYRPGGAPAHPQLVAATTSVTVGATGPNEVATARLWVVYRTGTAGSSISTQALTVRDAASGRTWQVGVDANTVPRRTVATALALDRSASMGEDSGAGAPKHVVLQQAANVLVDLMLPGDGVGVVGYNQDAQPLQPVRALGDGGRSDVNRGATHDLINSPALDPGGETSIGGGIAEARSLLDAPAPDGTAPHDGTAAYDRTALVVLTDGVENSPRWISEVSAPVTARTYAVGLGMPQNISVPALQTVSGNNGGFLLVTGALSGEDRFLLQKCFLQVLAGINDAEIVLNPDGELRPGAVHRIPFQLSDADAGVEVVLLTPAPASVDFRLQTPTGQVVEPWRAIAEPAVRYHIGDGVSYYRLALPVQLRERRFDQAGTWHALLTIGDPRLEPTPDGEDGADLSILRGAPRRPAAPARRPLEFERAFAVTHAADDPAAAVARAQRGLPYSLVVHAYSTLSLRAEAHQRAYHPGAEVTVTATLAQSGIPAADGVRAWVEITRPDGGSAELVLGPAVAGGFAGTFTTTAVGVYRLRVRARGRTRTGVPFARERALTATAWHHDGADPRGAGTDLGGLRAEQDR